MNANQFSLRKLLMVVALIGVSLGIALGGMRFLNGVILKVEQDAMRQSIIKNEIDNPGPPQRLNSEYARTLLGDEIGTLRAQRQLRLDSRKD